jgi:DNA-binding NtrC family response regulator
VVDAHPEETGLGRAAGEADGDLQTAERVLIESALRASGGHRRKAAERLGISERTLYRKIKQYGI